MERKFDLEDRLVRFAGESIHYCNSLGPTFAENHLCNQLIRSSTGACLNYGEAQGAESKKDFIHKNGIVLKELKESRASLKIQTYAQIGDTLKREILLKEAEELCAIFASIISKTKRNMNQ
ncbi:four helix bundle protein [Algoriphagus halophilus]|uniref:four helix bundle protein n=1 Tax=Algoriphagus halophilus TaxID=226505 RepID=UPI00358FAA35